MNFYQRVRHCVFQKSPFSIQHGKSDVVSILLQCTQIVYISFDASQIYGYLGLGCLVIPGPKGGC